MRRTETRMSVVLSAMMAVGVMILCWVCLWCISAMCHGANLIPNGSFELLDPNDAWKAAGWHMGSVTSWRVTDNYLPVPDGRLSAYGNPGYWIWSSYPFGVFETGPYVLSLWARQADCQAEPVTLILQAGVNEGSYQARTTLIPDPDGKWRQYWWDFAVTSQAELWIGVSGAGDGAAVVDAVNVEAIPEPATWLVLMALCGMAVLRRGTERS